MQLEAPYLQAHSKYENVQKKGPLEEVQLKPKRPIMDFPRKSAYPFTQNLAGRRVVGSSKNGQN